MYKYFKNVTTLDELKKEYRRLAMLHHPDRGGDLETMKAINAEYDRLFEVLKQQHNAAADEYHQTTETAEEFRKLLVELSLIEDITIELCGSWLWVGGNTRPAREKLKALKLRWSSNKQLWYWHHPEQTARHYRGSRSMDEIRSKYGSQSFSTSKRRDGRDTLSA